MHVVQPKVHVERLVSVPLDKVDRSSYVDLRHFVLGDIADRALAELAALLREAARRQDPITQPLERHQGLVESVCLRQRGVIDVPPAAHVPLAEMRRRVPRVLEDPSHSGSRRIQEIAHPALAIAFTRIEIGMNQMSRGILSRRDPDSRGRADRRSNVKLLKADAFGR